MIDGLIHFDDSPQSTNEKETKNETEKEINKERKEYIRNGRTTRDGKTMVREKVNLRVGVDNYTKLKRISLLEDVPVYSLLEKVIQSTKKPISAEEVKSTSKKFKSINTLLLKSDYSKLKMLAFESHMHIYQLLDYELDIFLKKNTK